MDKVPFSDQFYLPWTSVREDGTPVPYQMVFRDDAAYIRDRIRAMEERIEALESSGRAVVLAWRHREGTAFTESIKQLRRDVRV